MRTKMGSKRGGGALARSVGLVVVCLGSGGCLLVHYDEHGLEPLDAGSPEGGPVLTSPDAAGLDRTLSDGAADTGVPVPAASSDGSSMCLEKNACGGCSPLVAQPASSCGRCGLGSYACDGAEALLCNGGDALAVAPGGAVPIDDFEDGDSRVTTGTVLDGHWYVYSDGTAGTLEPPNGSFITPVADGAAGTARAAHLKGGGFTTFGAGLIVRPNTAECAFDATNERGLGFWIKGSGLLYLSVATSETTDPTLCGGACNDHYKSDFVLNKDWSHYTVQFVDLQQQGWGTVVPFEKSHVQYLQFSFGTNQSFELYLDEVSFF